MYLSLCGPLGLTMVCLFFQSLHPVCRLPVASNFPPPPRSPSRHSAWVASLKDVLEHTSPASWPRSVLTDEWEAYSGLFHAPRGRSLPPPRWPIQSKYVTGVLSLRDGLDASRDGWLGVVLQAPSDGSCPRACASPLYRWPRWESRVHAPSVSEEAAYQWLVAHSSLFYSACERELSRCRTSLAVVSPTPSLREAITLFPGRSLFHHVYSLCHSRPVQGLLQPVRVVLPKSIPWDLLVRRCGLFPFEECLERTFLSFFPSPSPPLRALYRFVQEDRGGMAFELWCLTVPRCPVWTARCEWLSKASSGDALESSALPLSARMPCRSRTRLPLGLRDQLSLRRANVAAYRSGQQGALETLEYESFLVSCETAPETWPSTMDSFVHGLWVRHLTRLATHEFWSCLYEALQGRPTAHEGLFSPCRGPDCPPALASFATESPSEGVPSAFKDRVLSHRLSAPQWFATVRAAMAGLHQLRVAALPSPV